MTRKGCFRQAARESPSKQVALKLKGRTEETAVTNQKRPVSGRAFEAAET